VTRLPPFDMRRLESERLCADALEASLEKVLSEHAADDLWVFGYGSLMWNPEFDWDQRHVGAVYGYHRSFGLWSRINRGTPDQPGLVVTLERGGSCRGLAYRLRPDHSRDQLSALWRREMTMGSYLPRWLDIRAGDHKLVALAFVVNRCCTGYAGKLPMDTMVHHIATARGKYGTSAEYLFRTEQALREHGIRDARVQRLADRVRRHLSGGSSAPQAAA
jgi:cation transport protein ChaC